MNIDAINTRLREIAREARTAVRYTAATEETVRMKLAATLAVIEAHMQALNAELTIAVSLPSDDDVLAHFAALQEADFRAAVIGEPEDFAEGIVK